MMDCRHYDKKITIEQVTATTPDAYGQIDLSIQANWGPYTQAFATCVSKGGREFWKVQQVNADVSHVWRCPWSKALADATPAMRLVFDGLRYEILSVVDVDLNHREIEIQTRRAV